MNLVEAVIDKRIPKLVSQDAAGMDNIDARATRFATNMNSVVESHNVLAESVADITRKLAVLFVWPVALTKSRAKSMVYQVLDERAIAAVRVDLVVTAPPAGTTCDLQLTSSRHAGDLIDAVHRNPIVPSFPDGAQANLRSDFAKPEPPSL